MTRLEAALAGLEESLLPHGRPHGVFGGIGHVRFDPVKHPRDAKGEFRGILGKLSHGGRATLPSGVTVHRHGRDAFEVEVPGEPDRVTGTLPHDTRAAQHGGHAELHTASAAAHHAMIADHELTLGERGTLGHRLASNRLVERERRRVADELHGLYRVRTGVRGFLGRSTAFGHELASDPEVPAWARWGMKLAVTLAIVPVIPGDELLGPLIVGALMVRPSTRRKVKGIWNEAKYGLPPEVDIPTSEKVERALRRSWDRVQASGGVGIGIGPGRGAPPIVDRLGEALEELALAVSMAPTRRGSARRSTPAGRGGGRGTSGASVASQSAQVAKAAAVRANKGEAPKRTTAATPTAPTKTEVPDDEETKTKQRQQTGGQRARRESVAV